MSPLISAGVNRVMGPPPPADVGDAYFGGVFNGVATVLKKV